MTFKIYTESSEFNRSVMDQHTKVREAAQIQKMPIARLANLHEHMQVVDTRAPMAADDFAGEPSEMFPNSTSVPFEGIFGADKEEDKKWAESAAKLVSKRLPMVVMSTTGNEALFAAKSLSAHMFSQCYWIDAPAAAVGPYYTANDDMAPDEVGATLWDVNNSFVVDLRPSATYNSMEDGWRSIKETWQGFAAGRVVNVDVLQHTTASFRKFKAGKSPGDSPGGWRSGFGDWADSPEQDTTALESSYDQDGIKDAVISTFSRVFRLPVISICHCNSGAMTTGTAKGVKSAFDAIYALPGESGKCKVAFVRAAGFEQLRSTVKQMDPLKEDGRMITQIGQFFGFESKFRGLY